MVAWICRQRCHIKHPCDAFYGLSPKLIFFCLQMTSSIAIINPNQHQSYQKKKGNKGRRKGKKKKKKVVLICHKCLPLSFFLTNTSSAVSNMYAAEERNTESLKLCIVSSHHTKLTSMEIRVEGHSGDVSVFHLDFCLPFKGFE